MIYGTKDYEDEAKLRATLGRGTDVTVQGTLF